MIDQCNATITVLLDADEAVCQTITCVDRAGGHHRHYSHGVLWRDTSPGATPHAEPEPLHYVLAPFGGPKATVFKRGSGPKADFFGKNAVTYAQEHADRLNREVAS